MTSPDRIRIFTQSEQNSKAKTPMQQNATVNLPSSNLPLSQGNCAMW